MILCQDNYPQSLPAAYDALQNYKSSTGTHPSNPGVLVSFLQTDSQVEERPQEVGSNSDHICPDGQSPFSGRNGRCFPTLLCYRCNRYGHITSFCPSRRNVQGLQVGVTLA